MANINVACPNCGRDLNVFTYDEGLIATDRTGSKLCHEGDAEQHLTFVVEQLAIAQHDAYEAAAVTAGWSTQTASRKPWEQVPAANKATMRESVKALLVELDGM